MVRLIPTAAAATAVVRAVSSRVDAGLAGGEAIATAEPLGLFVPRVSGLRPPLTPCFAASVVCFAAATGRYVASIATPIDTALPPRRPCRSSRMRRRRGRRQDNAKEVKRPVRDGH